jgi:hypothetical protein
LGRIIRDLEVPPCGMELTDQQLSVILGDDFQIHIYGVKDSQELIIWIRIECP